LTWELSRTQRRQIRLQVKGPLDLAAGVTQGLAKQGLTDNRVKRLEQEKTWRGGLLRCLEEFLFYLGIMFFLLFFCGRLFGFLFDLLAFLCFFAFLFGFLFWFLFCLKSG